jgi:hypothetical protein
VKSGLGGLPKYRCNFLIVVDFNLDELFLFGLTPQNSSQMYNQSCSDPGFKIPSMFCLSALHTCLSTAIYTLRAQSQPKLATLLATNRANAVRQGN